MATKANEIILELKAENKLLAAKLKETEGKLDHLENKTKKSSEGMGGAFGKLKGLIAGYIGVEAIKHIVNLAGEVESVGTSFQNLAVGAKGGSEGLLEALRNASKETVSNLDIMKSSNLAFQLMGEQVADHLPKMMEIAMASAKATGKRTADLFNDIVVASGRRSIQILDNLGISSAKASQYQDEFAEKLGKTRNTLTEAEKSQAFFYATMKAGEELIQKVGTGALTFGQKLQVAKARMENLAESSVKILTPALDNLLGLWLDWTKSTGEGESFFKLTTWVKGFALFLNNAAYQIEVLKAKWDSFVEGLGITAKIIKQLFKTGDFSEFSKNMKTMWEGTNAQATLAIMSIDKKYKKLNQEIMDGGRQATVTNLNNTKEQINSLEELRKAREQELNDKIAYYEYINQFEEAAHFQELLRYEQIQNLKTQMNMNTTAMMEAYEKKKVIANAQANNKMKQSDIDYIKAKMGLDRMEYQNAKEVFSQGSTLMQSKNKMLFNMGKALSYATAIMSAAEGVARIWGTWGAYPPIAAAFTAITLAATGVQIAKIKATKLPSYQRGRLPSFADGYYPANHFPAMIGADEAVINGRSTAANASMLKYMNDNPGQRVGGSTTVIQNNNFNGNVMNEEFVNGHVIPNLEKQARYQGKQLFAERR